MKRQNSARLLLAAAAATLLFANAAFAAAPAQVPRRDGQHDFDFHFGTWRTHILARGAAGQWMHMTGTVTDLPVWHGRANLEKIEAAGSGGHFQGVTLFLYDRKTAQWSQRYASSADGIFDPAYYGHFSHGQGRFYGIGESDGGKVMERGIWSRITPDSYHYEIASSTDGGRVWKTEFIAQLSRISKSASFDTAAPGASGHERDFDFNVGSWSTSIRAVLDPLKSPGSWSELHGTHVVRRVWDDWANLGQLEVDGPQGHVEFLALRLYDRKSAQWRVYFANGADGRLDPPMIGTFAGGVGRFVSLERVDGKTVLMRNKWYGITASACRQDWSLSTDGGKTWIPTWISTDTLQR
jgi:hypothetical protein